jgi:hypothetical protein
MADMGINFRSLRDSVDWSQRQMVRVRENRLEAIKQFVGKHYAGGGTQNRVPTNFIELAVSIYTQQLAARPPRVMVTTKVRNLKPSAYTMELALNQLPDEIRLGETLRRAVVEAMFCLGIVKVGIAHSGVSMLGHDIGSPFVDLVTADDYFMDMSAKRMDLCQYEGNDYFLPVETARDLWTGKRSEIQPDKHTLVGIEGTTRADSISVDEGADVYKERVHLRDVWLPEEQKMVTYGVTSGKVFNIVEWDGPDIGPYYKLGFSDVPGNLLPLAPVALWRDLHELGNSLFRKLGKQADVKKTIAAFQGGNDDDVMALQKAADGEGIKYSGQPPVNIGVGGIDAPTLAFWLQCRDIFTYFAGNLDTLGGLSPKTDTVGQDKLMAEAASARVNYMKNQTMDFVKGIFKALAWYEWTDPERKRMVEKVVPGEPSLYATVEWSAETRKGDYLDYNFDIDVHSMEDSTPSLKLQKLELALSRFILPVLQFPEQINLPELTDLVAKLANLPELLDVVTLMQPLPGQPERGNANPEGKPSKPANTTRTYERVNRPGATQQGKTDVMSRILMGAGVQQSEAASLNRPIR